MIASQPSQEGSHRQTLGYHDPLEASPGPLPIGFRSPANRWFGRTTTVQGIPSSASTGLSTGQSCIPGNRWLPCASNPTIQSADCLAGLGLGRTRHVGALSPRAQHKRPFNSLGACCAHRPPPALSTSSSDFALAPAPSRVRTPPSPRCVQPGHLEPPIQREQSGSISNHRSATSCPLLAQP